MKKQLLVLAVAAVLMGWADGRMGLVRGDEGGTPGAKLSDEQIKGLVEKLGDDHFKVRTEAHQALVAAGAQALPEVEKAAESSDPEVAEQAREVNQEIHRAMAPAIGAELAKNMLWAYPMDDGAAWTSACAWPVISGDTAYVIGREGKLHAVDVQTGKMRWVVDGKGKGVVGNGGMEVSAGEKAVLVLQNNVLTVFDMKEGGRLWEKELKKAGAGAKGGGGGAALIPAGPAAAAAGGGGGAAGPMVIVGMGPGGFSRNTEAWVAGDVVVARVGDKLHGYKAQSGEDAWEMDLKPAKGMCESVMAGGVLYVSSGQAVAAVDLATQKELWRQEMPACNKLVLGGDGLVCWAGGKLEVLEKKKGEKVWGVDLTGGGGGGVNLQGGQGGGGPAAMTAINVRTMKKMVVDEKSVYLVGGDVASVFDLKTGASREVKLDVGEEPKGGVGAGAAGGAPGIGGASVVPVGGGGAAGGVPKGHVMMIAPMWNLILHVVAANGVLYTVSDKAIVAYESKGGARLWALPIKSMLAADPVVLDGVLYFATSGNNGPGAPGGNNNLKVPAKPGAAPAGAAPAGAVGGDVAAKDGLGMYAVKLPK